MSADSRGLCSRQDIFSRKIIAFWPQTPSSARNGHTAQDKSPRVEREMAGKGHEERFPPTRLSAGCGLRKETIADLRGRTFTWGQLATLAGLKPSGGHFNAGRKDLRTLSPVQVKTLRQSGSIRKTTLPLGPAPIARTASVDCFYRRAMCGQ